MPDLKSLFAYLEQRVLAIRNIEMSAKRGQQPTTAAVTSANKPSKSSTDTKQNRFHPYERHHQSSQRHTSEGAANDSTLIVADCPQCGNGIKHHLWQCSTFRELSSTAKFEQLAKWGICEICLRARHKSSDCTKGACPVCKNGKHNSLICPQAPVKKVHHVRRDRRPKRADNRE